MKDDTSKSARVLKVEVTLDPEIAKGAYVNMARIFHNQTEFVLDGLFAPPGEKKATVRARLILSPVHAKSLYAALGHNLSAYEGKFGTIATPGRGGNSPGPALH